jgi:hypothetical protein
MENTSMTLGFVVFRRNTPPLARMTDDNPEVEARFATSARISSPYTP